MLRPPPQASGSPPVHRAQSCRCLHYSTLYLSPVLRQPRFQRVLSKSQSAPWVRNTCARTSHFRHSLPVWGRFPARSGASALHYQQFGVFFNTFLSYRPSCAVRHTPGASSGAETRCPSPNSSRMWRRCDSPSLRRSEAGPRQRVGRRCAFRSGRGRPATRCNAPGVGKQSVPLRDRSGSAASHTSVMSSGRGSHLRHVERPYAPAPSFRATVGSRGIWLAWTGDSSTPLRCGRNDGGAALHGMTEVGGGGGGQRGLVVSSGRRHRVCHRGSVGTTRGGRCRGMATLNLPWATCHLQSIAARRELAAHGLSMYSLDKPALRQHLR